MYIYTCTGFQTGFLVWERGENCPKLGIFPLPVLVLKGEEDLPVRPHVAQKLKPKLKVQFMLLLLFIVNF